MRSRRSIQLFWFLVLIEALSGCCLRIEGELSDESEVLGGMIITAPASIFAERDIEHPMELVFDGPVCPGDLDHALGGQDRGQQEVAHDHRLRLAASLAVGLDGPVMISVCGRA